MRWKYRIQFVTRLASSSARKTAAMTTEDEFLAGGKCSLLRWSSRRACATLSWHSETGHCTERNLQSMAACEEAAAAVTRWRHPADEFGQLTGR